jgi:hypothetical protein
MHESLERFLSHAENRIRQAHLNALLHEHNEDQWLAEESRRRIYDWIGIAQEQHQEDHF